MSSLIRENLMVFFLTNRILSIFFFNFSTWRSIVIWNCELVCLLEFAWYIPTCWIPGIRPQSSRKTTPIPPGNWLWTDTAENSSPWRSWHSGWPTGHTTSCAFERHSQRHIYQSKNTLTQCFNFWVKKFCPIRFDSFYHTS